MCRYNLWSELVDETAIGAAVDGLAVGDSEELLVDQGFIAGQQFSEQSDYTGKLSGLFIAPNSGTYRSVLSFNI